MITFIYVLERAHLAMKGSDEACKIDERFFHDITGALSFLDQINFARPKN